MALLEGIDEDAVDFRENYDGSDSEPVVLPAAFPNLLANGASGIAVGMATSIPPHNAGELLAALAWMAGRARDAARPTVEEMLRHVQGPDLPTGGLLVESGRRHRRGLPDRSRQLPAARTVGAGGAGLRPVPGRGHRIPYQVQKGRLVERLAELLAQKKLPLLADLRDESTEAVRLVLVPRSRSVTPELLMEQLFRQSDLEVRLPLNLNVLDAAGVPRVMSLAEALEVFLAHRLEVLIRRSRHRLAKVLDRLEVLEGYLKAFLDLDEVIRIIREEDEPKPALIVRFELTAGRRRRSSISACATCASSRRWNSTPSGCGCSRSGCLSMRCWPRTVTACVVRGSRSSSSPPRSNSAAVRSANAGPC